MSTPSTTPAAAASKASSPTAAATKPASTASCRRHAESRRPLILAERFRTKLCRNHIERGTCPYVHRCMFAHGKSEMRTTAQNIADRLFSEDAIRAFKRRIFETKVEAARKALASATPPSPDSPDAAAPGNASEERVGGDGDGETDCAAIAAKTPPTAKAADASDVLHPCNGGGKPPIATLGGTPAAQHRHQPLRRRHDPYALTSQWHPIPWYGSYGGDSDDGSEMMMMMGSGYYGSGGYDGCGSDECYNADGQWWYGTPNGDAEYSNEPTVGPEVAADADAAAAKSKADTSGALAGPQIQNLYPTAAAAAGGGGDELDEVDGRAGDSPCRCRPSDRASPVMRPYAA